MRTKVDARSQHMSSSLNSHNHSTFPQYQALFPTVSSHVLRAQIRTLGLKIKPTTTTISTPMAH